MKNPVLAYVEQSLMSGELCPGDQLPTERSLSSSLNVPRSAVRRAFDQLERDGRVVRHVGRGTFLTNHVQPIVGGPLMTSPAEIIETRLMIEPEIAYHAAQNATPNELSRIELCMRRGNACETQVDFENWDSAFHRAITLAVHNQLLLRSFDVINASRDLPVWGSSKFRAATAERRANRGKQHAAVFEALTDRDPDGARSAMITHLKSVRENLLSTPSAAD